MHAVPQAFSLALPAWLIEHLAANPPGGATPDARMAGVIELARLNVAAGTGGPFGAAVFERDSHRLVAVGVNMVAPSGISLAHAEMVALSLAQRALGTYDLGSAGLPEHELVTSTEPCAMCLGAIPWSGVRHVVCGARHEDACAIGMDEGDKPADWKATLASRGIRVECDVLRSEAAAVLREYRDAGGVVYNARRG